GVTAWVDSAQLTGLDPIRMRGDAQPLAWVPRQPPPCLAFGYRWLLRSDFKRHMPARKLRLWRPPARLPWAPRWASSSNDSKHKREQRRVHAKPLGSAQSVATHSSSWLDRRMQWCEVSPPCP